MEEDGSERRDRGLVFAGLSLEEQRPEECEAERLREVGSITADLPCSEEGSGWAIGR